MRTPGPSEPTPCTTCDGRGHYLVFTDYGGEEMPCDLCDATGTVQPERVDTLTPEQRLREWLDDYVRSTPQHNEVFAGSYGSEFYELRISDLQAVLEELSNFRADAERWRALLSVGRVRLLGYAMRGEGSPVTDGEYVHFGAEFWTKYPDHEEISDTVRTVLTGYADAARRRLEQE